MSHDPNFGECEQPLWEIRALADALYCISLTPEDEMFTKLDGARDHAINILTCLILDRTIACEKALFGKDNHDPAPAAVNGGINV